MTRWVSEDQIVERLRRFTAGMTTRAAAKALRVQKSRISEYLNKRRRPNKAIIKALGFDPTPHYRRRSR